MELSLIESLSSTNDLAQRLLNTDSALLEKLVTQLTTPHQEGISKDYSLAEIETLSKQIGIDITNLAYPLTVDPLSLRQEQTLSSQISSLPQYDFSAFQNALEKDKQKAKELIQSLVEAAKATKQEFAKELNSKPIHPYERMIQEYLGKNFKPTPIEDIAIEPDLDLIQVLAKITELSRKLHEKAMLQVRKMTEQALDTTFPGITSEALGTAFATLSGDEFVVDHEMMKRHLQFVETIRAFPVDYVVKYPYESAKKLVSEFLRCDYNF